MNNHIISEGSDTSESENEDNKKATATTTTTATVISNEELKKRKLSNPSSDPLSGFVNGEDSDNGSDSDSGSEDVKKSKIEKKDKQDGSGFNQDLIQICLIGSGNSNSMSIYKSYLLNGKFIDSLNYTEFKKEIIFYNGTSGKTNDCNILLNRLSTCFSNVLNNKIDSFQMKLKSLIENIIELKVYTTYIPYCNCTLCSQIGIYKSKKGKTSKSNFRCNKCKQVFNKFSSCDKHYYLAHIIPTTPISPTTLISPTTPTDINNQLKMYNYIIVCRCYLCVHGTPPILKNKQSSSTSSSTTNNINIARVVLFTLHNQVEQFSLFPNHKGYIPSDIINQFTLSHRKLLGLGDSLLIFVWRHTVRNSSLFQNGKNELGEIGYWKLQDTTNNPWNDKPTNTISNGTLFPFLTTTTSNKNTIIQTPPSTTSPPLPPIIKEFILFKCQIFQQFELLFKAKSKTIFYKIICQIYDKVKSITNDQDDFNILDLEFKYNSIDILPNKSPKDLNMLNDEIIIITVDKKIK